jgi:hypothetical protein
MFGYIIKRALFIAFGAVLAFTGLSSVPEKVAPRAQAGQCSLGSGTGLCGTLHHYNGVDPTPIRVRCDYGVVASERLVYENQYDPCVDMDQLLVPAGKDLWCRYAGKYGYYYVREFTETGWHKTNDLWNKSCTLRVA